MEEEITNSEVAIHVAVSEDVPPPGTPCIVCRRLGHFCAAARYIGNTDDGICRPCVEMKNCPQALAQLITEGGEGNQLITDSMRHEILAAPHSETDVSVGNRTGISPQYVGRIRKAAGITPPKEKCVVEDCEHHAATGYSYCGTRHGKELRTEQYDQIVAARKLVSRLHKSKPKPPVLKLVAAVNKTLSKEPMATKVDEFSSPSAIYDPEKQADEAFKKVKKVEGPPTIALQTVQPEEPRFSLAYDVVIRHVESQIEELLNAEHQIAELRLLLSGLKKLRGPV